MPPTSSLLALLDVDDLACAEAVAPEALAGHVLALDTDIHLTLQEREIEHRTPWDIVARDERAAMEAMEAAVRAHWSRHGRIDFEGINLLAMAAFRHVSALARLTWAAYLLRRAVEELSPSAVVTFDEPSSHGLDQPADNTKMPLLFGVLRGIAERAGIPVRLISRDAISGPGFEDQVAARNRTAYAPVDVEGALGGEPFVLFQANGEDLLRQLPLIARLRRDLRCQAVQLYKDASPEIVDRIREAGHHAWHESQVTQWRPVPEASPIARGAYEAFLDAGRKAPDDLRVLFDNPHVRSHFDFLFGEYAAKMAEHVRAWRSFFARSRPAAFVANYHAPIYDVAAAEGIPCLGLPHGLMMVGHTSWFQSLPARSAIGAISERHRQTLIDYGIEANRIVVTGDPWGDRLLEESLQRAKGTTPRVDLRAEYGLPQDRRIILLCTCKVGIPAKLSHLPYVDWADGVRCTQALADLARRRGDWAIFIKPHPRWDLHGLYRQINRALPPDRRLIVLPPQPLGPLVEAADVTCCWCAISSALVEASLVGRPVMMFAQNLIWYDPTVWATDGWFHANTLEEFQAELDRLFKDPQHYAARVRQTQDAARAFLGDTSNASVNRCLGWLRRSAAFKPES